MRLMKFNTLGLAFSIVALSVAAEPSERLLSGKALVDALEHRRSLNSAGQGLRQVVADLQHNAGIVICLDRRTDPSASVDVATSYVTTRAVLESLAKTQSDTFVSFADQYVMIGPATAVNRLRTVAELRRQDIQALRREMSSDKFRELVSLRKVSWPRLTQPRQLLIDNAVLAGVEIENPQMVPHDLWAAAELPAMAFTDLATLVLNQFDLTFEISSEGVLTIVSVPDTVGLQQRHRISSREKDEIVSRWIAAFPDLQFEVRGSMATVVATVETHERLQDLISGSEVAAPSVAGLKSRLFTLKVQRAPFGALITELRGQGVPIRIEGKSEAELTEVLQETAAFDLTKSPSSEFFSKIFEGSGAEVTVTDEEVVLTFPK